MWQNATNPVSVLHWLEDCEWYLENHKLVPLWCPTPLRIEDILLIDEENKDSDSSDEAGEIDREEGGNVEPLFFVTRKTLKM